MTREAAGWEMLGKTHARVHALNKMKIVVVLPSMPFPANANGVAIRYFPILRYMANRYSVDIVIISRNRANNVDQEYCDQLKAYCRNIFIVYPDRHEATWLDRIRLGTGCLLPWSSPVALTACWEPEVQEKLIDILGTEKYDCIIWISPLYANMIRPVREAVKAPKLVIDFIDSAYLFAKRKSSRKNKFPLLRAYETWKMKRWERGLIELSDKAVYVSSVDAKAVQVRSEAQKKIHVIPNGIYVDEYVRTGTGGMISPSIGFLGNMSYPPNIEAVEWLYSEVYLPVRKTIPNLNLYVIGRNPVPAIQKLGNDPNITVTGTVDNIWQHVHKVDVFVLPIMNGSGLKNKILEAMYAGRPVVTTAMGNEGIDASPNKEIIICNTPAEFRGEVVRLLQSKELRQRIGSAGRAYVNDKFMWEPILKKYDALITSCIR